MDENERQENEESPEEQFPQWLRSILISLSPNKRLFGIFGIVAVLTIIGIGGYFWLRGEQPAILKPTPTTAYVDIYACADQLFQTVSIFGTDNFDARNLDEDFLFVLNKNTIELYLYTHNYAGKAQLEMDKNGEEIPITKEAPKGHMEFRTPDGELIKEVEHEGRFQYNVRIPYFPNKPFKKEGYYYMTINDTAFDGQHDGKINFPPRFLAGEAQERPTFSAENTKFHPLDIEDRIWDNTEEENVDQESLGVLTSAIASRVGQLDQTLERTAQATIRGQRGFGGSSLEELRRKNDQKFHDILTMCEKGARRVNNEEIVKEINIAREKKLLQDTDKSIVDTSDWKIYQNDKYGFGFQYPPSYTVFESETPDIRAVTIIREVDKDKPSNVEIPFLGVYAFKNPSGLTVVEWCNEKRSKKEQQLVCRIIESAPEGKIRKEAINDIETFIIGTEDSAGSGYVFSKNDSVFELLNYELFGSNSEVLKILSTFTFTSDTNGEAEKMPWEKSVCGNEICEQCEDTNSCCNYPCTPEGACPPPTCLGWCPQDCPTPKIEVSEPPAVPTMRMWYKGENYKGEQGSGCWPVSKEEGALCWDSELPVSKTSISASVWDDLTVITESYKPPTSLSATFFDADSQKIVKQRTLLPKSETLLPLEVPAGNYIVVVFGGWDEGDISYGFKVNTIYVAGNPACEVLVDEAAEYYEPYTYKEGELGYQREGIIRECNKYLNKSCTTNQDCGSFPCVDGACFIKPCNSDTQCPTLCGLHATPVPRFCTTIDVK